MSVETLRNQSKAKITLLQQRQKNTLDKTKKIIIMSSGDNSILNYLKIHLQLWNR